MSPTHPTHSPNFLTHHTAPHAGLNVSAVLDGARLLFKRLPDSGSMPAWLELLSTHPSSADRVAAMARAAHRLPPRLQGP